MRTRRMLAAAIAAALGASAVALPARAERPSVARARYADGQGIAGGTVFFLDAGSGPVAVGVARAFDRRALAASPEITFELGRTHARVAASSRLLAGPGAGSLRDDLVVFALDAPPAGVRVLRPGAARARAKVHVLGIPGLVPGDQDALAGRVRAADGAGLEVELEDFYDVRGWAGAPIVADDGGGVLGFLQAVEPDGKTLRVLATPIDAVVDALRSSHEGGLGRSFASLAASGRDAPAPAAAPLEATPAALPPVRPAGPPGPVTLAIEHPPDGTVLGGDDAVFVAGRAIARRRAGLATDVVFAIDSSSSAGKPSGVDVNGNGIVGAPPDLQGGGLLGRGSVDPGDSVLAAEVAAVRRLVVRLDPRHTRVGLVTFAGELLRGGALAEDAAVSELALTSAYEDLHRALDRVLARGPRGATHMAAGVDRARIELLGLRGAFSEKSGPHTQKIMVFVTDGVPTLPVPGDEPQNVRAVLAAAARAREAGIRVIPYGVGSAALEEPLALVDLARITGGTFMPVRDPARLSDLLAEADLAEIAELEVRNATLGATATAVDRGADGSFGARVPLRVGRNEIEVAVRAADGGRATRRITIHYAPDAPVPTLPPLLLASQNRVLTMHLTVMRRERVASEQERIDALRRQLRIEIERERARAVERAERQRKRLDIRIEDPESASAE